MVKYTLVMDLAKQFSTRLGKDQLINSALMGDGRYILNQYDPTKTYHLGDKIPYLTDTGELVILTAIEDNITGPLDLRKWEEWDIISETIRLYQDFIQLSWHVPKSRLNRVWLSIKKESMADFEGIDINQDGILVYSNFIISKERPTMTKNVIWGKVTELVDGAGTVDPGGWDDDYEFPHINPDTGNMGDSDDNTTSDPNASGKTTTKLNRDFYRMVDVYPSTYKTMTSIDVNLDTSDLTDTSYMFALSSNLREIPPLKTEKVTTARSMFSGCGSLTKLPSKKFDELVDGTEFCKDCTRITGVDNISFTSLITAPYMFAGCRQATFDNLTFGNLDDSPNMFYQCTGATLNNTTFGKIKNGNYMFHDCTNIKTLPRMDIRNITNASYMFSNTRSMRGEFKQSFNCLIEPQSPGSSNLAYRYNFQSMLDSSGLDSIDITFTCKESIANSSTYHNVPFGVSYMNNLKRMRVKSVGIYITQTFASRCPELQYLEIIMPTIRELQLFNPGKANDSVYRFLGYSGLLANECQKLRHVIVRCDKSAMPEELINDINSKIEAATVGASRKVHFLDYNEALPAGVPRFEDIDITVPAQ